MGFWDQIKVQGRTEKFLKKVFGILLFGLGWLLSPLTWWNDVLINLPLAWLMASIFFSENQSAFSLCFIISYWMTNLMGFILMHLGWKIFKSRVQMTKKDLLQSFLVSLAYTLVILVLVKMNVLRPLF